ncbi:hypothetical protein SMI01S_07270 [Sphingobacterium mizutaii NBRC 14946 = DSM 11724]|nr:hypothetical protein SMI01S_07270 [Sphingobacterium mizutaii NBRC 14946 = DSM 11724]
MLLLLGLSSCKKDETFNEMETFVINGETFSVSETRMRLAVILDIDENRLTYIPEKVAFKLDTRNDQDLIYIEPIIESIKNVKLPKSQSYR